MALLANALLVILALFMGVRLTAQYRRRPRPHTLWYAIGLLLTAVAAAPELWHSFTTAIPLPLWWLYWMTAATLVGALGAGSAYLISAKFGKVAAGVVVVLTVWIVVATVLTVQPAPLEAGHAIFLKAPTTQVKLPFVIQNILGALTIFGVAIWSFIKTRGMYNVWIALGTLLFSSGGTLASRGYPAVAFYAAQAVGIVVLYFGVTAAGSSRAPKPETST